MRRRSDTFNGMPCVRYESVSEEMYDTLLADASATILDEELFADGTRTLLVDEGDWVEFQEYERQLRRWLLKTIAEESGDSLEMVKWEIQQKNIRVIGRGFSARGIVGLYRGREYRVMHAYMKDKSDES